MQLHDLPGTPFTSAGARALGVSRKRLAGAVEDGLVRRVLHGVDVFTHGEHEVLPPLEVHDLRREQLARGATGFFRRRGVVQLRRLIPLADPRAESPRESWTRLEIIDAGLPTPEPQVWISIGGVPTYRLDLAHPRLRVAVEYDGEEFHDRTDEQKRHDAERREWLEAHGWAVIVVKNGDLCGAGLDRWLGELRRALRPTYSNRRW